MDGLKNLSLAWVAVSLLGVVIIPLLTDNTDIIKSASLTTLFFIMLYLLVWRMSNGADVVNK